MQLRTLALIGNGIIGHGIVDPHITARRAELFRWLRRDRAGH